MGLAVERILAVDDTTYWVNGWAHDEDGRGEVVLVSPEGARVNITAVAYRHERPDVIQFYSGRGGDRIVEHGFTANFQVSAPGALSAGWIAELHASDGQQVEIPCPPVTHDLGAVRAAILDELGSRGPIGGPWPGPRTPRPDQAAAANRRGIAAGLGRLLRRGAARAGGLGRRAALQAPRLHRAPAAAFLPRPRAERRRPRLRPRLDRAARGAGSAGPRALRLARSAVPSRQPDGRRRLRRRQPTRDLSRPCQAPSASQLGRDPRPAGMAGEDVRVPRLDRWDRRARPEAALRGRLAAARRDVLPATARGRGLGERPLLQGHAPELRSGERRPAGSGGDRRLHDGRPRPLRGGRRPATALRAGRLRGFRALPAAGGRRPQQLVPARGRALSPRGAVLLARYQACAQRVQQVASIPPCSESGSSRR